MRRIASPFVLICCVASVSLLGQESDTLRTGENLRSKNWLVSSNKEFFATPRTDGNFCIYQGARPAVGFEPTKADGPPIWCSASSSPGGVFFAVMGNTGNFCVARGTGPDTRYPSVWCTNTPGPVGSYFARLNVDGNFQVFSGTPAAPGNVIWSSGVSYPPVTLEQQPAGSSIQWPDGKACPPVCSRVYPLGATIRLTASTTQTNFLVREWTGTVCAAGPSTPVCELTVHAYSPGDLPVGIKYVPANTVAIRYRENQLSIWYGVVPFLGPAPIFYLLGSTWTPAGGRWVFDDGLIRLASNPVQCIAERLAGPNDNQLILKSCDRNDQAQSGWSFSSADSTIRKAVDPAACLERIDVPGGGAPAYQRGKPCTLRQRADLQNLWTLLPY